MLQITPFRKHYGTFEFDELGQTRIAVLLISLLILFGLTLAYNVTFIPDQNYTQEPPQTSGIAEQETVSENSQEAQVTNTLPEAPTDVGQITNQSALSDVENSTSLVDQDTGEKDNNVQNNTQVAEPSTDTNNTTNNTTNVTEPNLRDEILENTTNLSNYAQSGDSNDTQQPPAEVNTTGNVSESPSGKPNLHVSIEGPDRITRGHISVFHATITNTGSTAKDVVVCWKLPSSFEVVSENTACDRLNQGESCDSTIKIMPSSVTSVGEATLNVEVNYD